MGKKPFLLKETQGRNGVLYYSHGKGVYEYKASGIKYTGDFKMNQKHGVGTLAKDKDAYNGEFYNGERTGVGKISFKDGSFYEGSWLDNKFSGKGRFNWPSGEAAFGDFSEGKPVGVFYFRDAKGIEKQFLI
jgi:hypothetical protein